MKNVTLILSVLLLAGFEPASHAESLPELLKPVDAYKAERLVEYNGTWIKTELYSAKRYRIVAADSGLLLKDEEFTVTPFDNVDPIHLSKEHVLRWDDAVAWNGEMHIDVPAPLQALGFKPTVLISMMAWDTDEAGNALDSSANRFKYSPYWRFDNLDQPKLEIPAGESAIAGPPPQTPEDIARHKQLLKLKKHAFYSVRATFELSPNTKYMLVPLKSTPKYSVIFEVDPKKDVPFKVDSPPLEGAVTSRTPADVAKVAAYENFVRSLPPDNNVPVVGDLP
jgi:hypothetical protein